MNKTGALVFGSFEGVGAGGLSGPSRLPMRLARTNVPAGSAHHAVWVREYSCQFGALGTFKWKRQIF